MIDMHKDGGALPFQLRANDIQRHIINIDSRFRDSFSLTTAANFYHTLLSPIRNILRIRITSFEFPNNYYMFTSKRKNVAFQVIYQNNEGVAVGQPIYIPDGTYTACELEEELTGQFKEPGGLNWLSVSFNPITGHFIFTGTQRFAIDTEFESYERGTDYGLGYYMGFSRKLHKAVKSGDVNWVIESDCQANFAGDSYILMRLNDYKCVKHYVEGNELSVFAKFILHEQKNNISFDDYSTHLIKEVTFNTPQDLARLHVQILDPYGELLDLGCNNYSFSIEILEIKNPSLYNAVRNSLGVTYE
jgi:hypothetical protein